MRTCILPLAMQTRALILVNGSNDCSLSAALSKVVVGEQARLGDDCPFTVLATVLEEEVHAKAAAPVKEGGSAVTPVAAQIARGSRAWRKRVSFMNDFYSRTTMVDEQSRGMPQCDLTAAAER